MSGFIDIAFSKDFMYIIEIFELAVQMGCKVITAFENKKLFIAND